MALETAGFVRALSQASGSGLSSPGCTSHSYLTPEICGDGGMTMMPLTLMSMPGAHEILVAVISLGFAK